MQIGNVANFRVKNGWFIILSVKQWSKDIECEIVNVAIFKSKIRIIYWNSFKLANQGETDVDIGCKIEVFANLKGTYWQFITLSAKQGRH